jgi:AraC family transcriptional regulator of arabinose operon
MDMKIISVQTNSIQNKNFSIMKSKGREYYLFVLFKSPTMLYLDGEYKRIEAHCGVLFDKHKKQGYYAVENTTFNHDFLLFDTEGDVEEAVLKQIPMESVLTSLISSEITSLLGEIENVYPRQLPHRDETLSYLANAFLLKVADMLCFSQIQTTTEKVAKIKALRDKIYKEPNLEWDVDTMSREVCISRYHFERLYKSAFNISCINDVINARVTLAQKLLLSTELSINEIAEMCGYKNIEHFSRQFKKKVGACASEFRK